MSTTLLPIGLWGASESGKTTYISALYLAFLQAGQEDHDVHNLDDPFYGLHRWSMEPANQDARILINEQSKGLEQGEFPQASIEPRKYQFDFYKRGNPLILDERTHHLNVIDGKGEEIRDPESSFMQHLANCEGILLLIDPSNIDWTKGVATVPSELANDEILTIRQAIDNLFEVLEPYKQKNGFYDVDIAICVTKMDRDDCWPERHNARKFVRELIGQAAYNLLGNRCEQDRYRFFATSVVGRFTYRTEEGSVIERANITDEGGTDKIADLSAWEPYQMLDPLFWLFDRMEIKQRKQPYRRIKPDPDNRFLWAGAYLGKFLIWLVYYLPWRLWRQPCHGVSKWDYLNSYRIRMGQWISWQTQTLSDRSGDRASDEPDSLYRTDRTEPPAMFTNDDDDTWQERTAEAERRLQDDPVEAENTDWYSDDEDDETIERLEDDDSDHEDDDNFKAGR